MNSRAVFQSKPHLLLGCLVTGFAGASSQATVPVEEFELAPFRVIGDVLDSREIVPSRLFESPLGGTDSVLEMPRSVTLVSPEQLAVFGVRNYEDMQGLSSSLFSSSIFGISGTPDIRGAIAETYYRGMKRADNRGIFPQPIGAAQRLEIIKGPPSPLHGAGALGGYVNFVPKTARAEEGGYLESHEGLLTLQVGSYNQRIADLEFGGPLSPQDSTFTEVTKIRIAFTTTVSTGLQSCKEPYPSPFPRPFVLNWAVSSSIGGAPRLPASIVSIRR